MGVPTCQDFSSTWTLLPFKMCKSSYLFNSYINIKYKFSCRSRQARFTGNPFSFLLFIFIMKQLYIIFKDAVKGVLYWRAILYKKKDPINIKGRYCSCIYPTMGVMTDHNPLVQVSTTQMSGKRHTMLSPQKPVVILWFYLTEITYFYKISQVLFWNSVGCVMCYIANFICESI